jgi:hypothetical protein
MINRLCEQDPGRDQGMTETSANTPQANTEATESAVVAEGTEVDYRAAYEALKAEQAAYRAKVRSVMVDYGHRYTDGCEILDRALGEVGLTRPAPARYDVEVTLTLRWTHEANRSTRHNPNPLPTRYTIWDKVGDAVYEIKNEETIGQIQDRHDVSVITAQATAIKRATEDDDSTAEVINLNARAF